MLLTFKNGVQSTLISPVLDTPKWSSSWKLGRAAIRRRKAPIVWPDFRPFCNPVLSSTHCRLISLRLNCAPNPKLLS